MIVSENMVPLEFRICLMGKLCICYISKISNECNAFAEHGAKYLLHHIFKMSSLSVTAGFKMELNMGNSINEILGN